MRESNVGWDRFSLVVGPRPGHRGPRRRDRAAVGAAIDAGKQAKSAADQYGGDASSISGRLTPFLTQELTNPQGYSQQDLTSQLSAAEAGAGGATSGITGQADLQAARSRNPGGFTAALDEAARDRDKAAAGVSEGVAANNADLKQKQQQEGAAGLGAMYGEDTDAMLKSMGLQTQDINAQSEAGKSGWFQNFNQLLQTINGGGQAAGSLLKAMK